MNRIKEYIGNSLKHIYPSGELKSIIHIICRDILELRDTDIYICKDINLSVKKQTLLEEAVGRLSRHEPIQYVVGYTDFYGLTFTVKPGVLIPRPETEELVALIINENKEKENIRILDIGTGSGCIAVSLSKNLPEAAVEAWDISEAALNIAQENNRRLNTSVTFEKVDVLNHMNIKKKYDVIVSNPPYIAESEKAAMDKNVLDWEPGSALFVPDSDPLVFYKRIAELGITNLHDGGKLYFEINRAYGNEVAEMLGATGYREVKVIKDLFGNDRIIKANR